jgi:predicted  nucleic acid-binding Zn-ribbon protein
MIPRNTVLLNWTFLAWLNIYQNLKQAIQDVIAPEMQQLRGEIKALSAEIGAVHQRMDSFERRLDFFENRVDKRFDAIDREWPRALDIYQRLPALEARLEKH